MARVRQKFSDEFKQEAVRLVTVRGVSMAQAARGLGYSPTSAPDVDAHGDA